MATNIFATEKLVRASAIAGVRRLVFTSSLYAHGGYGPRDMSEEDLPIPKTLYGISKLTGEHLLRAQGFQTELQWNCARLFFTYGPGQYSMGGYKSVIVSNFERLARGEEARICGSGTQELDYVYVDDVVAALVLLGTSAPHGHVVNVSSGSGTSVNHLTQLMIDISGSRLRPRHVEPDETEGTRRVGTTVSAKEVFNWSAEIGIEQGLAATWRSLKEGL